MARAKSASRMGIDELLKRNVAGGQVLAPLTQQLGIPEWEYSAGGMDENGNPLSLGVADPGLAQKLAGYTFDWQDTGPANTGTLTAYDPAGAQVGAYDQRDQSTGSALGEFAALAAAGFGGLGALGLGPMAGLLGGAAGGGAASGASGAGTITGGGGLTAGGSAGYGTIGGTLGGAGGTTLGVAGGGMSAGAGLNSALLQSLAAVAPASVLPSAMQSAGGLLAEAPVAAANPSTAAFNAAADSQLASSQLGITGAQSAAAATAPATVNLGSLGGTMGTAGGMQGAFDVAKQVASDTLLNAKSLTSPGAAWMKDNPTLGRLLMGGATGLLSSSGSNSSGAPAEPSGPPVTWNSSLQQGLLSPVQQYAPAAIQQNRPAGLLAQGYANDGAWRYLKG